MRGRHLRVLASIGILAGVSPSTNAQPGAALPAGQLVNGLFLGTFSEDDGFALRGGDFPPMDGRLEIDGEELTLTFGADAPEIPGCDQPGRYAFRVEDGTLHLSVIGDDCGFRRVVMDGSAWRPPDRPLEITPRRIEVTTAEATPVLPAPDGPEGAWPSFRGPHAAGVSDGMDLPETWDGETGHNILWRVAVPGLGHSSPVIWGDRIYLTSAISSDDDATFRPGLYGDGDASSDDSPHRWVVSAFDKRSGRLVWQRTAYEGRPNEARHIKSTYASATPATDGRVVVAYFGSQGLHAFTVDGDLLWRLDLGHVNVGAYNAPNVEWGSASSPVLWNGRVYLQVDTQEDDLLLCLDATTGDIVWRTARDELSTWGTPTVVTAGETPVLVTNGSNFIRGYDPRTGDELWRLGGSSKITAPTPVFTPEYIVVASGRAPERPLFVLRHGADGDLTLPPGQDRSEHVAWSRVRRGPYMPTPLVYEGILYVLGNNGVLDAYRLETGEELYRERIPHAGYGFSASPVAADGRVYLSNEDGDIFVIRAGPEFAHLATNPLGELLMATPALSDGVLYVRSVDSLFAIGNPD